MEKEILGNKSDRYAESGLYGKLQELHPECYDLFLSQLTKVVRSSSEKEILLYTDILLEFAVNKKDLNVNRKIIETTVDEFLPVLNRKTPEKIKSLVSNEYKTVLENLEEIRKNSDEGTASKCLFGEAVLTFPGSKIIDEEN